MSCTIIDGKAIAKELLRELKEKTAALREKGVIPGLTVIIVGEDPASLTYVASKEKKAKSLGFNGEVLRLPENTTQEGLCKVIDGLNADPAVDGILVQLPLPRHINKYDVIRRISPDKDVDGFHVINSGCLFTGLPGFVPCTPKGIIKLIESTGVPIEGKHAVVLGRSLIVGKPVAQLLLDKNATVTVCHSHTGNDKAYTKSADIVVAAVGKPGFLKGDMIKPGAIVIDVGIHRVDGALCGDVVFDEAKEVAGFLTPVPGGVGPMTIAELMENTYLAALKRLV